MNLPLDPNPMRHPRQFGFLIFNAICVVLLVAWLTLRVDGVDEGILGLPNLALYSVGIVLLAVVWAGTWIAWGVMVWNRHRPRGTHPEV